MPEEETRPESSAEEQIAVTGPRGTRPTTDANVVIQLLVAVVGSVLVSWAVTPLKDTNLNYLWAIIRDRGPVQYFEVFMAFMVATFIFMKARIVRNQLGVIASGPIGPSVDFNDDEQVQDLRESVTRRDEFAWSILLNRIERALALWLGSKDVSRVASWAASESDRDVTASDSSYATVRVLIWALPILGFIGTVMGLGQAVSGFAKFLAGAAELTQIKEAIAKVTVGLGVAFDTTLLALILTTFLMFPLSWVQRREEGLFVEMDNYMDDHLISHLPSPEQQPIVIENLEDSIEAAFRRYIPDPDRYDEVFTRSIERAAATVEEKFSALAKGYETTLSDISSQLSAGLGSVGDQIQGALSGFRQELEQHETQIVASQKQAAAEQHQRMKELVQELKESSQAVAQRYEAMVQQIQTATESAVQRALQSADKTAQQIIQAAEKSATRAGKAAEEAAAKASAVVEKATAGTIKAAEQVSSRLAEVSKLAAGIEKLLHAEEAMEKAIVSLATAEEFQKTLKDLRKHLTTTDEFCARLSKPRVITLREEVVE
ncbi:MAG TPA: hypothetical protein EYP62_08235 [Kiritimatiellae bacterium]|nr:hypothetical protein [Kiritimatiellia bacterium]